MVELGGIEPPSVERLSSALRPFPRSRLYGCRAAGSVGSARESPPGLSPRSAVFHAVSGLSHRQPPLLLPGCGDLAPRAIAGRDYSLFATWDQAARANCCSSAVVLVRRLRSLRHSGRTVRLPVSTSKPISPVCSTFCCQRADQHTTGRRGQAPPDLRRAHRHGAGQADRRGQCPS